MVRRNAEKQEHQFENDFAKECGMYDLQGLLIGEDTFTAAVEAFTYEENERIKSIKKEAFTENEWLAKLSLANSLCVDLYLFIHKNKSNTISCYIVNLQTYHTEEVKTLKMTEKEFVEWWCEHKKTVQNKKYRPELSGAIKNSYFDQLLESNGLKWGGNIDGFLIANEENNPLAIIENRFTSKESIKTYDPLQYYNEDIMTWKPLIMISELLNIPCFLCTFSKIKGEGEIIGISELEIREDNLAKRFVHKDNLFPGRNLYTDIKKAKEWLFDRIYNR